MLFRCSYIIALAAALCQQAAAEHPIQIERLTADKKHFEAVIASGRVPVTQMTYNASMALAKSLWALGLVDQSEAHFDELLTSGHVKSDKTEQARIYLAKGIIELQEGRFQVAAMQAEKAFQRLEQSPLRGEVLYLWAEALSHQELYGAALPKYTQALLEADPRSKDEMLFRTGQCERLLGKNAEAREHLEQVSLESIDGARALRALAEIEVTDKQFEKGAFWATKGRELFADDFLDAWVDYALVLGAISKGDDVEVKRLMEQANNRYPPSEQWLVVLNATAESFLWRKVAGGEHASS
jgi:tetratricopeptide (TPR) repeat protein